MADSDDTEAQWLYEVLKDVQLERFFTRIKDELQASFKQIYFAKNQHFSCWNVRNCVFKVL